MKKGWGGTGKRRRRGVKYLEYAVCPCIDIVSYIYMGTGGVGVGGSLDGFGSEIVLVLSFLYSGREAGLIYHSNITHNSTLLH